MGCLDLLQRKCSRKHKEKRIREVLDVFELAGNKSKLSPVLYQHWLDILTNVGLIERAIQVVQVATSQHAKSVPLWEQYLQILMRNSANEEEIIGTFKKALLAVNEKESLSLWNLVLDYCANSSLDKFKDILERGLFCCPLVSSRVKEFHLEWTFLTSDIHQTRNLYKKLVQMKPVTMKFYKDYISMELSQPKPKMKLLRNVYEDAIMDFGSTDSDLWIDLIKMELSAPGGKPEKVGNIHFRAVRTLDGTLNQRFITQYTLLQTGVV